MIHNFRYKQAIVMIIVVSQLLQVTACGTIFYPQRKGQKEGEIDPIVAVADAIGLVFFIIPGVIAFACDFSNGTIYLPNGKRTTLTESQRQYVIKDGKVDLEHMQTILKEVAGVDTNLQVNTLQTERLYSSYQLQINFARAEPQLAKM